MGGGGCEDDEECGVEDKGEGEGGGGGARGGRKGVGEEAGHEDDGVARSHRACPSRDNLAQTNNHTKQGSKIDHFNFSK